MGGNGGSAGRKGGDPTARRRLLAVDDEELLLKAYRRMLADRFDVETRVGAVEALRALDENEAYDLILCDLQMPGLSGAEFFHRVKTRWPALASRFIFITGGAYSPDARTFLESAAISWINKPFHRGEILALIDARLEQLAHDRPSI